MNNGKEIKSKFCDLEYLGIKYSIDCGKYSLDHNDCRAYLVKFGDLEVYIPCVKLSDGRFAYPVYEVTEFFNEKGRSSGVCYNVIGWCVKGKGPHDLVNNYNKESVH